jgi:D-galacturonate reductase
MDINFESFPKDTEADPRSYKTAIDSFQRGKQAHSFPSQSPPSPFLKCAFTVVLFNPGDCCIIFTPDDTHFDIAMYAIQRGLHVLVTKPVVQTLDHHKVAFQEHKPSTIPHVVL